MSEKKYVDITERSNIVKKLEKVPEILNRKVDRADSYLGSTYSFFVGWLRYGGGGPAKAWIAAAVYNDNSEVFAEKIDDLDAGDYDALMALEYIQKNAEYYAYGETPSMALKAVEDQIAEFRATL